MLANAHRYGILLPNGEHGTLSQLDKWLLPGLRSLTPADVNVPDGNRYHGSHLCQTETRPSNRSVEQCISCIFGEPGHINLKDRAECPKTVQEHPDAPPKFLCKCKSFMCRELRIISHMQQRESINKLATAPHQFSQGGVSETAASVWSFGENKECDWEVKDEKSLMRNYLKNPRQKNSEDPRSGDYFMQVGKHLHRSAAACSKRYRDILRDPKYMEKTLKLKHKCKEVFENDAPEVCMICGDKYTNKICSHPLCMQIHKSYQLDMLNTHRRDRTTKRKATKWGLPVCDDCSTKHQRNPNVRSQRALELAHDDSLLKTCGIRYVGQDIEIEQVEEETTSHTSGPVRHHQYYLSQLRKRLLTEQEKQKRAFVVEIPEIIANANLLWHCLSDEELHTEESLLKYFSNVEGLKHVSKGKSNKFFDICLTVLVELGYIRWKTVSNTREMKKWISGTNRNRRGRKVSYCLKKDWKNIDTTEAVAEDEEEEEEEE